MEEQIQKTDEKEVIHQSENRTLDILDRSEVVQHIMDVFEVISNAHSSCTFALNGKWGVGKTFVLDLLQEQLQKYQESGAYIVFHYNCWQYDFFTEPLVAIASAMAEDVDEETHVLAPGTREKLLIFGKGALQFAKTLASQAVPLAISALPPGVQGIASGVCEYGSMAVKSFASASPEGALPDPDGYFYLKKQVEGLRKEIAALSEESTVIVLVDELDRCLPEYEIKVLERLHHVFDGIKNTAVLIATDKSQLEHTVKQIYGSNVDAPRYLKKFIRFELNLNAGIHGNGFWEKYSYYKDLFVPCEFDPDFDLDTFAKSLFEGLDMREQDRLVERAYTIHKMLFPEEKKDYAFMCAELAWLVLSDGAEYINLVYLQVAPDTRDVSIQKNSRKNFEGYLSECWKTKINHFVVQNGYSGYGYNYHFRIREPLTIASIFVYYLWGLAHSGNKCVYMHIDPAKQVEYDRQLEDLEKAANLMRIIA